MTQERKKHFCPPKIVPFPGDFFAPDGDEDPFDASCREICFQQLRSSLEGLPQRDREILKRRFGFEGEEMTFEKIGKEFRISRERVRQITNSAIKTLRKRREKFPY